MWGLDIPSTMQISMPDYKGDLHIIGGWAQEQAGIVYDHTKAFIDPVLKAPEVIETDVSNAISGVYSGTKSKISAAFSSAVSAAAGATSSIWSPLSSGIKWATGIIVVGIFIYLLAVIGPFIPKPKGA